MASIFSYDVNLDVDDLRIHNPRYVYADTGPLKEETVYNAINEVLSTSSIVTRFMVNVVTGRNGPVGVTYIWFSNMEVAYALCGDNIDGSKRGLNEEPLLVIPACSQCDDHGKVEEYTISVSYAFIKLPDKEHDPARLYCGRVPDHIDEGWFKKVFGNFVSDPSKKMVTRNFNRKTKRKEKVKSTFPIVSLSQQNCDRRKEVKGRKGRKGRKRRKPRTAIITFDRQSADASFALMMAKLLVYPSPKEGPDRHKVFTSRLDYAWASQ